MENKAETETYGER